MSRSTSGTATAPQIDAATRSDLVLQNRPLVTAMAVRTIENLPAHVGLDEVIAAGLLGLTDAAATFDPRQHGSFAIYARNRVRGVILDCIGNSLARTPMVPVAA